MYTYIYILLQIRQKLYTNSRDLPDTVVLAQIQLRQSATNNKHRVPTGSTETIIELLPTPIDLVRAYCSLINCDVYREHGDGNLVGSGSGVQ